MSEQLFGNVPERVHELARRLTKKFEVNLEKPSDALQKEIGSLIKEIEALGFTVAIVAVKDARGDVEKLKLAVFRKDSGPKLH